MAVVFGAASIFFGVFPSPLFTLVAHAGNALGRAVLRRLGTIFTV